MTSARERALRWWTKKEEVEVRASPYAVPSLVFIHTRRLCGKTLTWRATAFQVNSTIAARRVQNATHAAAFVERGPARRSPPPVPSHGVVEH